MTADNSSLMGVILVNKPKNWTSFDVCGKLRCMLHIKRIGHTGTLDPMAEGVLPVLVGKAAKACDILPESGKEYRAGFKLGLSADTQDITGVTLETDDVPVTAMQLESVLSGFKGVYMQTPPMYSAVKVDGKKLYEYAREGKEIKREPKERYVHSIRLLSYDEQTREGETELTVSKGTYIRTLIADAAQRLGTHGVMTSLVRTRACGFSLDECLTIDQLQALADKGEIGKAVISLERVFDGYPVVQLDEKKTVHFKNGVKFRPVQLGIKANDESQRLLIKSKDVLLSVAYIDNDKNEVRSLRNFY